MGKLGATSSEISKLFPDWMETQIEDNGKHSTQISSTIATYKKIGLWLIENGQEKSTILDASSGLGLGTFALREMGFDCDDVEPYPSRDRIYPPTYDSYNAIGRKYDVVISNAVLNVCPDDWRDKVVEDMSKCVKDGGIIIVNTRTAESIKAQKMKRVLDSDSEILVLRNNGKVRAYQKGYTDRTITEYIKDRLGDGWVVKPATLSNSGIKTGCACVAKKVSSLSGTKNENSIDDILQLVREGHRLTDNERLILRGYQGNGGKKVHERGVLDEFYTPDYICDIMYRLAIKYGYCNGDILEPSCATGNIVRPFYESGNYQHIDAFEINPKSREIFNALYSNERIKCYDLYFEQAFLEPPRYSNKLKGKTTWLPNYGYNLVIGNPPYGKHKNLYSAFFNGKDKFEQIEMFFMYKCLQLLNSAGLLIFITSTNMMSTGNKYQSAKDKIGEIANLLDAYRLPSVFKSTQICTDIIVLQKK